MAIKLTKFKSLTELDLTKTNTEERRLKSGGRQIGSAAPIVYWFVSFDSRNFSSTGRQMINLSIIGNINIIIAAYFLVT